eukprot:CAMPEP_0201546396 /NCGR_PEP_ID=MMETSP0173_2-20130828/2678_1 /ASSEMBLY_ACC=CAM_ASM_000268 /TAXON_ID=218659 /ORGANISM="Vexillifera sp., Strain DIVA3 564/2" /LENGTH=326 /DNA_ID=CAMNT_0047955037 /DNA_START=290 /DNA_END=1266 /DNA_ORIENTATION=+
MTKSEEMRDDWLKAKQNERRAELASEQNPHAWKSMIAAAVHTFYERFVVEEKQREALSQRLDGSKRSAISRDVISKLEENWGRTIQDYFFPSTNDQAMCSEFVENFYERPPYAKNVIGAIKSISFQFMDSPKGFTQHVLTDIMQAVFTPIRLLLEQVLSRPLSENEQEFLVNLTLEAMPKFLSLYEKTVQVSELGRKNQGVVSARITKEQQQNEKKLEQLKADGKVDAKFEAPKQYNPDTALDLSQDHTEKLKDALETTLSFAPPPDNDDSASQVQYSYLANTDNDGQMKNDGQVDAKFEPNKTFDAQEELDLSQDHTKRLTELLS